MLLVKDSLSALQYQDATFTLDTFTPNQYARLYPQGYRLNFVELLSGVRSIQRKSNTTFYITDEINLEDVVTRVDIPIQPKSIFTALRWGNETLKFTKINPEPYKLNDRIKDASKYGYYEFIEGISELSYFVINFIDNRYCTISTRINYNTYYLVGDVNRDVFFASSTVLPSTQNAVNPQIFEYVFDDYYNFLYLTKTYSSGTYLLRRDGEKLNLNSRVSDISKATFQESKIVIDDKREIDASLKLNTSFVTYTASNTIDIDNTTHNLKNNYLVYRCGDFSLSNSLNLITLKNQVLYSGDIASANTLLSGYNTTESHYVENIRQYTTINDTIPQEETSSLELNYIFNNFDIRINPGVTTFITPDSMQPFRRININDLKLAECGAFSYTSPDLADKVYQIDWNAPYSSNQHYLCTWLSGGPDNRNKVWVDRYYYPDQITKQQALTSVPVYANTFTDPVEQLILTNSSIKTAANTNFVFDKKSDLVFEPSKKYRYERTSLDNFVIVPPIQNTYSNKVKNWFEDINSEGKITLGITFPGNSEEFIIRSDRNDIDGGVEITKNRDTITFTLKLYNPSTTEISTFTTQSKFEQLKTNTVVFSFDSLRGVGSVYLNTTGILDISTGIYKFTTKRILFGDIYLITSKETVNLIDYSNGLQPYINKAYISKSAYNKYDIIGLVLFLIDTKFESIIITLPCGMRNGVDNIQVLNSIHGNHYSKSNKINIKIKNTGIEKQELLDSIKNNIELFSGSILPATTTINSITFENYK